MPVHFLHISKTGGTAVRHALQPVAGRHGLVFHPGHWTALRDIPEGEQAFFIVRDPVSRFVSAFNSRLRCGRPRNNRPWLPREAVAFRQFPTPNALAEALSDPEHRDAARAAMSAITHVSLHQHGWTGAPDYLERRWASVAFVAFQHQLFEDFERLKTVLGLPANLALPTDPIESHATPAGYATHVSSLGTANITRWYSADAEVYKYLLARRRECWPEDAAALPTGS